MKNFSWLIVFIVAAGIYANTIQNEYALDDKAIITENAFTQKGFDGIVDHITHSYWFGINGKDEGNYRPISGISFSIEHALFGNNPHVSHFLNALFYGLLCVLIFKWITMIQLLQPILAFMAVMVFATHPIHTEVVANIKSRDEIYCLLFFILSAIQYWRWLNEKKKIQLIASSVLLLLSFLSKETAIALLPLFPLMSVRSGATILQSVKNAALPIVSMAVYLVLYFSVTDLLGDQQYHIFDNSLVQQAPETKLLATKIWIIGDYFRMLVLPLPLIYDYSYNSIELVTFSNVKVIMTLLILFGLVIWPLIQFKHRNDPKQNAMAIALALIILPLIPISNFLFPIGATMAERFLFIPSLGFALLLVFGIEWLSVRLKIKANNIALAICGPLSIVFAMIVWERNPDWKNNETLFTADIKKLPRSAKAHHNLANIYEEKGNASTTPAAKTTFYESAIGLLEEAIAIYPVQEFYKQLGALYGNLGKWDGVIKAHTLFIAMNANDPLVWMQRGIAHGISENFDAALHDFEMAHKLNPSDAAISINLAKTYSILGRNAEAVELLTEVTRLYPSNAEAAQTLSQLRGGIE